MNSLLTKSYKFFNLNPIKLNKNLISLIHTSNKLNSTQYYPINDDVFGLNEEQKQVWLLSCIKF
jgi:hypothetical protein